MLPPDKLVSAAVVTVDHVQEAIESVEGFIELPQTAIASLTVFAAAS